MVKFGSGVDKFSQCAIVLREVKIALLAKKHEVDFITALTGKGLIYGPRRIRRIRWLNESFFKKYNNAPYNPPRPCGPGSLLRTGDQNRHVGSLRKWTDNLQRQFKNCCKEVKKMMWKAPSQGQDSPAFVAGKDL